jgi:hypothetical protein
VTSEDGALDPLHADQTYGCRLLGADDVYQGSVIGGFLIKRSFSLKCGERPLIVTSSFKER